MSSGPSPTDNIIPIIADANVRRERIKMIENERAKLSATALNTIAVSFVVVGFVTPLLNTGTHPMGELQVALSIVWLLSAFILHFLARLVLGSLR